MASPPQHRTTAISTLQAVLEDDNHKRHLHAMSPNSAQEQTISASTSESERDSSLDLIASNADFPVIATATAHCVRRRSTKKLFEPGSAPLALRWMKVCTWPISEALGRVGGWRKKGRAAH